MDLKEPLKEEMATHFSTLDWEIPQTEEPDGLWGPKRVGYDLVTKQPQNFYLGLDFLDFQKGPMLGPQLFFFFNF